MADAGPNGSTATSKGGSLTMPDGWVLQYNLVGQGPLALCIIGSTGLAHLFRHIIPYFFQYFTLCLYDRRGFSTPKQLSDPNHRHFATPADCIRTNADDAAMLIEHLSPDSPTYIISTSFGSTVALDLLARYPQLVQASVIHEPSLVTALPEPARSEWAAAIDRMVETYHTHGRQAALEVFLEAFMAPVPADIERARMSNESARPEIRENSLYAFLVELPAVKEYVLDIDQIRDQVDKIALCCSRDTKECRPHAVALTLGRELELSVSELYGGHTTFADPRYAGIWSEELLRLLKAHPAFVAVEMSIEA